MIVSHEIIDYTNHLPIKLSYMQIGHAPLHWHNSLEILYILSGSMTLKIENSVYHLAEDDIALVNSNQIHETDSPNCTLIVLQLRLSMFHLDWVDVDTLTFDCNSATRAKDDFRSLKNFIAKLIHTNANTSAHNELLNYAYANQLMHELLTNFRVNTSDNSSRLKKHLERLKAITSYIDENYSSEITLTGMAAHEYLTPAYLSHFFEKHMGVTFSDYLAKVRVSHSITDLLYTDSSIEEIAAGNGFASARAYAAAFRKVYNCLPSNYRKNYKETKSVSSLVLKNNVSYLMLDRYDFSDKINELMQTEVASPSELSSPALLRALPNISVLKEQRSLKHTWRTFCSVGRARELLYVDIQDMLRVQQREIGFRYIKFHGIFDDALGVYREDSSGNPIYNFTYVDKALDFLLSVGLKPMIQLSFMPKALASDTSKTIFQFEFYISPPKDEKKWYDLVSTFTRHIISRYGQKEVMEWIFTFWNEALDYLPFHLTDPKIAFHLYEISYLAVKECNPGLTFASMSVYHEPNIDVDYLEYLKYNKAHSCEPDAYLFHFYPTWHDSSVHKDLLINPEMNQQQHRLKLHRNPDIMKESLNTIRHLVGDYNKPLYITEWNLTPSHRELLNDTCYSSCYIIKNILENYDTMDSFCHWSLTDWIEELEFAPELFHGGMGFFTKNGIKKPAYYAYYFLTKLEDILLEQGDGYFITKGNDRYVLLLYNYIHFSDLYADGIVLNSSFTERYNDFTSWNQVKSHVNLTDLPDGTYDITQTIVNRTYGSVFDQWVEMGALEPKYQEELDTLKSLSQPLIKRSVQTVICNKLSLNLILEPLEIRLIEIRIKE